MDDTTDKVADRRKFFKLAGATAAGAGATIATAGVAAAMYAETDHVKRYYELAR
jgi:hypothetical protein